MCVSSAQPWSIIHLQTLADLFPIHVIWKFTNCIDLIVSRVISTGLHNFHFLEKPISIIS